MMIAPSSPHEPPASLGSPWANARPTLADLQRKVIASGGNVGLFEATVSALGLNELSGPLALDQLDAISCAMATGTMALAGFNALPELLLSAGSNRAQTALFRECARVAGVDAAQLPDSDGAAIDEKFKVGLAEAVRRNGTVSLSLAQDIMRDAITEVAGAQCRPPASRG